MEKRHIIVIVVTLLFVKLTWRWTVFNADNRPYYAEEITQHFGVDKSANYWSWKTFSSAMLTNMTIYKDGKNKTIYFDNTKYK